MMFSAGGGAEFEVKPLFVLVGQIILILIIIIIIIKVKLKGAYT